LPTKYYNGNFLVDSNGQNLSYDEAKQIFVNRKWNKNGSDNGKKFLDDAEKFHDSLIINGKHVTKFMNSYFIVGVGQKTFGKFKVSRDPKKPIKPAGFTDGDGAVPFFESAIPPGTSPDDAHIFKFRSSHYRLIKSAAVIELVKNIISGKK
jgi:hypothetical protein